MSLSGQKPEPGVVVGVDSSTQSTKVLCVELESGRIRSQGQAAHPEGTAVDPRAWTQALGQAWHEAGLTAPEYGQLAGAEVIGAGVGAQQHGMVALDASDQPVFDALLWNDTRSAPQAEAMVADIGADCWAQRTGVVPVPSFTLTKLAWLAEQHPELVPRTHRVGLPHDWLNLQLSGVFSTDRSDASGTAYFDPQGNAYVPELLERYFGAVPQLPRVLGPQEAAGPLRPEWLPAGAAASGSPAPVLSAGMGDNAAAALGLGLVPGEVVVSVGTSGTVFTTSAAQLQDASGQIAGFADATGAFLPLLATLNAARVLSATAEMLQISLEEFDELALAADPEAHGMILLPYLDGERNPNLPQATGTLLGLSRAAMTAENLARAAVLGVLNSLADGIDRLRAQGVQASRVLLIGGGAKSRALRSAAAEVLGVPVEVPVAGEYVALGAARQAAWAATGEVPQWPRRIDMVAEPQRTWGPELRARYISARLDRYGI